MANMNGTAAIYELREAAQLIRKAPHCVRDHDRCECLFMEQVATWFERIADDLPLALQTARQVLESDRKTVDGQDWLKPAGWADDEPSSMVVGSSLKVVR